MSNEQAESNVLTNKWGEEIAWDGDRYPDGSPAKEGKATRPSGQGGATPKSRPDYQDQWPANPPPSASAKAKGEENDKVDRGELTRLEHQPVKSAESKTATKEDKK